MKVKIKLALFCLIACLMVSCDQVTKKLAQQHLMYQEPVSYLHNFFILQYAENTGAALSLGAGLPQPYNFILLSAVPLIVMLGLLCLVIVKVKTFNRLQIAAFALIFAGGIGNLIDRIFNDRHVTDFMIMGIGHLHTGIFNVADVAITIGVILSLFAFSQNNSNVKGHTSGLLF